MPDRVVTHSTGGAVLSWGMVMGEAVGEAVGGADPEGSVSVSVTSTGSHAGVLDTRTYASFFEQQSTGAGTNKTIVSAAGRRGLLDELVIDCPRLRDLARGAPA